jgi:hypothetical protein
MALHRLARLVSQFPSLISQLQAVSFEASASDAARYALTKTPFPEAKLPGVLADLWSLPPASNVPDAVSRGERFMWLDVVMMLSRGTDIKAELGGPEADGRLLDCNAMLREANYWSDQLVEALKTPRFGPDGEPALAKKMQELHGSVAATRANRTIMAVEALGGRAARKALTKDVCAILARIATPSFDPSVDAQDIARMSLEVEKTAAALALYKARHGRFPASLKELCPDLLKEVPKDVFSPKGELVYRANDNAYIVYSVGKNMKDDGGVSDGKDKDDIVAQVGDVDSATTLPASRPGR